MGIYTKILKAITGPENKNKNKPKNKFKMTTEQKEKAKARINKIKEAVQSGKLQAVTGAVTRYSQGKTVTVQNPNANPKKITSDTVNILGQELPKNVAYIGGALLLIGGVALAKKMNN